MPLNPQAPNRTVTRKLTISDKYFLRVRQRCVFFPSIRLSGKWLAQAGFTGGQMIDVVCEQNKLIITIAENNEATKPGEKPARKR